MAVIGAAASSHHVEVPEPFRETGVLHAKLDRVSDIQLR
jgi:hypothetical protein